MEGLKKENVIFRLNPFRNKKINRFWLERMQGDWKLIIQFDDLQTVEISQVK